MSKAHWLALSSLPGVGGVTFRKLLNRFGSVEAVFDASDAELLAVPRFNVTALELLRSIELSIVDKKLKSLSNEGIEVLTWEDDEYPNNLRLVNSSPPVLFLLGSLEQKDEQAVAIVGTRNPTSQAAEFAEMLGKELAERDLTVISGLANGIDSKAHRGALRSSNGRTLAIIGSGLKAIHPSNNIPLAEEIMQRGALLSEVSPETRARGSILMARDRITSGLSLGVIVVEADENSGSYDTARKALKQDRMLFAVPGSAGTDALLTRGAKLIEPDSVDFDWLSHLIKAHIIEADRGRQMSLF